MAINATAVPEISSVAMMLCAIGTILQLPFATLTANASHWPVSLWSAATLHSLRLHRRHHPAYSRQVEDPGPKVSGSFQLVRYYGWYSNKMRGQRNKRAEEEAEDLKEDVEVIDASEHQPRRIPSKKWRDLIKKVWEADPPHISPTIAHSRSPHNLETAFHRDHTKSDFLSIRT
jgi:ribosomal protein L30/L7E